MALIAGVFLRQSQGGGLRGDAPWQELRRLPC